MVRQITAILALTGLWVLVGCDKPASVSADPGQSAARSSAAAPRLHQVIEAEAMGGLTAPMAVVEEADTSGGKCVRIPAGLSKEAPLTGRIEATVTVPADVQAKVWYRVCWSGTCANSLTMKVGQLPEFIVGEDGTYKVWHWVSTPAIPLTAGEQTLVLAQREEDVAIDQILVTQDLEYIPMGIEE